MPDIFTASKEKVKIKKTLYKDLPIQERKPLSSFLMCPERVHFETREEEEKVVLFLRKHFITNIPWMFIGVIMLFVPTIVSMTGFLNSIPNNFHFIFNLIWYLITMAYILENFITWFFNVYIITDERIVDIDFYNLIYKEVSDANLDRIEDVSYKMGGVVRTLFNYGDVLIQTAAEVTNFDFLAVPYPDKVAKVLQDLRMEEEQEKIEGRVR